MTANLFSRDWYRIAELKPVLRKHVRIHAHRYRGKRWYVLEDPVTGENRRLTPEAYWIIGLMNGQHTIEHLWTLSSDRLGEQMPTHEELMQLVSSLYQANLIQMDNSGDIRELFEREHEAKKKKRISKLKSPLSIQIPLYDPEKLLVKTEKYVRPCFSKFAAGIWVMAILYLLISALQYWEPLTKGVADRVLGADNLLLLWLIYPIIKLVHEFGHAYAVKRYGGEVHEMGVMLLVMMPVPYVDASASGAFSNKYNRALVGAAGMLVELLIAAIAMLVWVNAEPGLIKSIAYNTLFIAGVSTLLVNGNPLLRFDGYYVLADFIEIPNLAQKANQAWGWLAKTLLFRVPDLERPGDDDREFAWLIVYGIASLIYRLFLTISIVLFVAQEYFFIGIVLGAWSFIGVWLWPGIKTVKKAWTDADIQRQGKPATLVVSFVVLFLVLFLAVIPFPLSTSVEGVVQFDEKHRVQVRESCFIAEVLPSGTPVKEGQPVASCASPQLITSGRVLEQQLAEARAQRFGEWDDPVQLKLVDQEISRLTQELEETRERIEDLTIEAEADGIWWVQQQNDLPGRYLKRGQLLGYVAGEKPVRIRALVPEKDIALVREHVQKVVAWSGATDWQKKTIQHWKVFPSADHTIPSPVLTANGGGVIVADPAAEQKLQAIQPYFAVDIILPDRDSALVEQRVFVKFVHDGEALIHRIYRLIRRTFLEYFDV